MTLDAAAVPFLVLIALGIVALSFSVLLRTLVDRRIQMAREAQEGLSDSEREVLPESFWLRYGEPVKRSIQSLAWTFVGLGLLNLVSYALVELAEQFATKKDGSFPKQIAADIQKLSLWIKQGADLILKIVVLAVVGVWIARFFHGAMRSLLSGSVAHRNHVSHPRSRARMETLLTTSGYVINVSVFVICFLMCLQLIGVSVAPLLATAGVASVAIGFGAQTLVRDLLAGFFVLFEDQFAVGDVIAIDGRSGTVESLTLRCTKLRLSDGSLLVVPNGEIKRVENATSGFSQIDYRISVLYGSQVEKAFQIVCEQVVLIAKENPQDLIATPELLGVESVKDSSVVLRARLKTRPGRQYALERELNQRVLKHFVAAQITLPTNK